MHSIYNFLINITEKFLPLTSSFSEKMNLFIKGRKNIFSTLENTISAEDKTIWFHAASLGEYEQAIPVIKEVKKHFPEHKIVLSFFSPSGFEIRKNSALADVVTYLPIDTKKNAARFLTLVHPEWAIFIKYEFWPNFLKEIEHRKIKSLLISGSFREDQIFFKSYGKWMRRYLRAFDHFFVQNKKSEELLKSIGFFNVSISGDTRFDRVAQQLELDNSLSFIEEFKNNKICVVAGSTWPEDEAFLIHFINSEAAKDVKFIIAPHTINRERIQQLHQQIQKSSLLFSEKDEKKLSSYSVFIIDTIGLLTKIYNYADVAFVGGAVGKTGLHNILEPATFGVPIVTGKNLDKFPEAQQLQYLGGLFAVKNKEELFAIFLELTSEPEKRRKAGKISCNFISQNTGATNKIIAYLC